jgi:hypothetical protein
LPYSPSTRVTSRRECFAISNRTQTIKALTVPFAQFSVSLIVQIHLQQNRSDLAIKEVQAAKRWAQDSLLVNIAESWVGLRVVRIQSSQHRLRQVG